MDAEDKLAGGWEKWSRFHLPQSGRGKEPGTDAKPEEFFRG